MKSRVIAALLVGLITVSGFMAGCAVQKETQARTKIVIISDIHMGASDVFGQLKQNIKPTTDFLLQIKASEDVGELVLAGDLFDQWVVPFDFQMPPTLAEFDDMVVKNNQSIVDAINSIIREGKIRVTYVPGNHDILFDATEVDRIFPGINQARDVEGLGTFRPTTTIAIEHGHRYVIGAAPDTLSNLDITGKKSILPMGYFFTRTLTTSVIEQSMSSASPTAPKPALLPLQTIDPAKLDRSQMATYAYYMFWQGVLKNFPLTENASDNVIETGIDGYTQIYSVNDIVPQLGKDGKLSVTLYENIVENWPEQQLLNKVSVPIDAVENLENGVGNQLVDEQAHTQYFDREADTRMVVFGHTHVPMLVLSKNLKGEDVIYANCGTWIDKNSSYPTCTYVTIDSNAGSSEYEVGLYQYNADGTSTLIKDAKIAD